MVATGLGLLAIGAGGLYSAGRIFFVRGGVGHAAVVRWFSSLVAKESRHGTTQYYLIIRLFSFKSRQFHPNRTQIYLFGLSAAGTHGGLLRVFSWSLAKKSPIFLDDKG